LLKPIYEATIALSAKKTPTCQLIFPHVITLRNHLNMFVAHPNIRLMEASKEMILKFNKYFEVDSKLHVLATILDPRMKIAFLANLFTLEKAGEYQGIFINFFNKYYNKDWNPPSQAITVDITEASSSDMSNIDKLISDFHKKRRVMTVEANSVSEADRYLKDDIVLFNERSPNILDWWKYNANTYPKLSKMARYILAVPATSVPSESTFSASGRIVDDYRTNLNPETVEKLMLGHNWLNSKIET